MQPRHLSRLLAGAGVTAAYFAAGKLGLYLAFIQPNASAVWPAAGIAIAALLVAGTVLWPAIFIGAFLVNATTAGTITTSLGIACGNTLEAVCAAFLIQRFANGTGAFDRYHCVFKAAIALLLSTVTSPSLGVTTLAAAGFVSWHNYLQVWLTWWLGDFAGAIIVTPVTMLWLRDPRRQLNPVRDREVAALVGLLVILAALVFSGWLSFSRLNYPLAFVLGPIIVWTAFRLSQREAATGIFLLSVIATIGTLRGFGPFVRPDPNESLLILQSFNVFTTVTALALAAGMAERRQAEARIEQQKGAVEAANRTKDNFLAMLSHELRTPLTPVIVALHGLESGDLTGDDARAAVAMIRRNVELESQLIDDLLDLTRIARDKLQLHFVHMDAHEAISNVVEICRSEAQAKTLRVHVNLRAGAHFINADGAKFQQIIWNLLKNAIKFTNHGGEIVVSSCNPIPQLLEIRVADTGIGMEREVMKRIFDPFEQGDHSFQTRFGGLGLGLAISKSLAEAHGGTLVARSEGRDRGSNFTVTMNTVSPPKLWSPAAQATAESRGLRILLVDDHPDTCSALERLLVRRGHLVAAEQSVRSAMEAASRGQFDLLISDIALPDGTGIDLIAWVRAMQPIRGIAISGFGMNGDIERSLKAGFSEHLVKPIKAEKLEAAIDRVMAQ